MMGSSLVLYIVWLLVPVLIDECKWHFLSVGED